LEILRGAACRSEKGLVSSHAIPASDLKFPEEAATPALVVWGREDRIVPLECGERYAKSLPRARLELIAGAGHLVDMEKPDALASLVTRFLTEV